MLPRPDYYCLAEVAALANCTEKYLIHLGANGKIPIFTILDKHWKRKIEIRSKQSETEDPHGVSAPLRAKLAEQAANLLYVNAEVLVNFEAYPDTAEIPFVKFVLPEHTMVIHISDRDGRPVKTKDCYLVIAFDDLDLLIHSSTRPNLADTIEQTAGLEVASDSEGRRRQKLETTKRHEHWFKTAEAVLLKEPGLSDTGVARRVEKIIRIESGGKEAPALSTIRNAIAERLKAARAR